MLALAFQIHSTSTLTLLVSNLALAGVRGISVPRTVIGLITTTSVLQVAHRRRHYCGTLSSSVVGDCQKPGLASTAVVAAELALARLLQCYLVTGQKEFHSCTIWTMPETAFVGQTTEQLEKAGKVCGIDFSSSKGYFADTSKWVSRTPHEINEAKIRDPESAERENAFVKILFHPKSTVVYGIHVVGPTASELIEHAENWIGKPLDCILRMASTANTLVSAFAAAALAGKRPSLPKEAMSFREPKYAFIRNFLCFDRNERMKACTEAFQKPENTEDQELLKKMIEEYESDPRDEANLMKTVYEIWNRSLVHLEETQWQDQAPVWEDQAMPSNAIVAVVGGKHTDGFRGTGDWIVSLLLHTELGHLFSHSRSAGDAAPDGCAIRYEHIRDLGELVKAVAQKKAVDPSAPVVFVYMVELTSGNGQNKVNNDFMQAFIDEMGHNDLLHDKSVKVLHTSTFRASPKDAGHEDNIAGDSTSVSLCSFCFSTYVSWPLCLLPLSF